MGWTYVGIDVKGYANTTYISEFHPQIANLRSLVISSTIFDIFRVFENQIIASRVLPIGRQVCGHRLV